MQLNEPLNEQFLAQNRIQLFQKPLRAPVVGVFFCALIVFSRFGADWAPGRTSWHTHSLTVRIKQQARCDANQNHLRLGACRSQAVPRLIYSDLDFTKIRCWGLLERGVHNIWRADNSNSPVTKEMVISLSLLLLKSPKSWKTPRGGLFWGCFFCSKQSSNLSPTWITQMDFLYSSKNILRKPEQSQFPILTLLQHKPATLSQMLWPFSCSTFCFFAKADRLDVDWWKPKWNL